MRWCRIHSMELKDVEIIDIPVNIRNPKNPFNGIESTGDTLQARDPAPGRESIQWNWKLCRSVALIQLMKVWESIQWNWKACCCWTAGARLTWRNPFNGIERAVARAPAGSCGLMDWIHSMELKVTSQHPTSMLGEARIHSMELKAARELLLGIAFPRKRIHSMELKDKTGETGEVKKREWESIQWNWKSRGERGAQPEPPRIHSMELKGAPVPERSSCYAPPTWIHSMELKGANSTTSHANSHRTKNPFNGIESE